MPSEQSLEDFCLAHMADDTASTEVLFPGLSAQESKSIIYWGPVRSDIHHRFRNCMIHIQKLATTFNK